MSLYTCDFKTSTVRAVCFDKINDESGDFSVIISNNKKIDDTVSLHSILSASKPIFYFSAIFGLQMVRFCKNTVHKLNVYNKCYSVCVIVVIITLLTNVKPISWKDTKADIPLNILTIAYTLLHYSEVLFIILSVPFYNSNNYIQMFRIFDDLNCQLKCNNRQTFIKMRTMSVAFTVLPITQVICTFFLRKFYISNIGVHVTIFVILIQGSLIYFFVISFYGSLKFFNKSLKNKILKNSNNKKPLTQVGLPKNVLLQVLFSFKMSVQPHQRCWLELMQMYDKLADSVYMFNKIYSGQVLLMFTTWLVCTLLIICRSLSPSLNYKEIYVSDFFIYTCINLRPFFLGLMCELIVKEWSKSRDMLIHVMIHGDLDDAYFQQVQTMLDLVEARRLEISANIFLVNIPTVATFAGRAISYSVLMIQYFYMHILK